MSDLIAQVRSALKRLRRTLYAMHPEIIGAIHYGPCVKGRSEAYFLLTPIASGASAGGECQSF